MYTPKRYQGNRSDDPFALKTNSPYGSPYQSLNVSKDHRDTPTKGSFQVLEQAEYHQLLTYGGNLPVKVAEVLSASTDPHLSAKIENSGWAYIIDNRKLYAWKTSSGLVKKTVSCFQFQLSPTELFHQASLTCLLETIPPDTSHFSNSKMSLINVSPEGIVRYWQNVTQPTVMLEVNLNIGEKLCSSIQSVMPYGCILVTKTNEMYLLSPSNSTINYCQLAVSTGMLSNIGKRLSSFWSQAPVMTENNHPPCICDGTIDLDSTERYVFVALDRTLQKWEVTNHTFGGSKMVFEVNLLTCVRNYAGIAQIVGNESIDDVQTIDMKNTGYGTVLLLALWIGSRFKVVLGTLKVNMEDSWKFSFERLLLVDYNKAEFCSDMKLLLPYPGYQAYISTNDVIISQPISKSTKTAITVQFNKPNSGIIGTGSCGSDAIYLSKRDGLVTLKVTYVAEPVLMDKSQMRMLQESFGEDTSQSGPVDPYSTLKACFISHSQGKMNIHNIVNSMHCSNEELSDVILKLSAELIDSYPPSDPRWATGNTAFPASSVLLLNQIRDKEKIHDEFLKFLSIYNLFEKVGDYEKFELEENAEKIRSVISLLEMPSHFTTIVDDVINSPDLDVDIDENYVNKKDSFFSKISSIGVFFLNLVKVEEKTLSTLNTIKEKVDLILAISEIFTTSFTAAWKYRQMSQHLPVNHLPWTGSTAGNNNRELLKYQIGVVVNQALPNVDSTKLGSVLTQQVVLLADLLFDGYIREITVLRNLENVTEIESIEEEYNDQRSRAIMAIVNLGYFEHAFTLAEQYKDFHMLILLCEKTNDTEKLKHYKALFKNEGFANVLCKWYMEKGQWSELMATQDDSDDVDSFLSTHTQLSWIHLIGSKEFSKASDVLAHLSVEEKEYCSRKKAMLVLANLAILAAEEPAPVIENRMIDIDRELELLNYQDLVFKSLGKDTTDPVPLGVEDLIRLCLEDEVSLEKNQYITLVEMLQFISVNRQSWLVDIWAKCILQDSWEESPNFDSVAVVSQKMFFQCLKYWRNKGAVHGNLPTLKSLMEFAKLSFNTPSNLFHQLKICYEVLSLQELTAGV